MRAFYSRASLTAIGSSDYHGLGLLGYSRTFVFTRDRTDPEILDAVRAGRTVVDDRGTAYGDPELIELASRTGELDPGVPELPAPGGVRLFSRISAVLGLAAALLLNKS